MFFCFVYVGASVYPQNWHKTKTTLARANRSLIFRSLILHCHAIEKPSADGGGLSYFFSWTAQRSFLTTRRERTFDWLHEWFTCNPDQSVLFLTAFFDSAHNGLNCVVHFQECISVDSFVRGLVLEMVHVKQRYVHVSECRIQQEWLVVLSWETKIKRKNLNQN